MEALQEISVSSPSVLQLELAQQALDRTCRVVSEALTCTQARPEQWLTRVCRLTAQHLAPDAVIAHCWVIQSAEEPSALRTLYVGVGESSRREACEHLMRLAKAGTPDGDLPTDWLLQACEAGAPATRRSDIFADKAWQASRARRDREKLGLHEFARAAAALSLLDGAGALVLQFDGLHPRWNPDALSLAALDAIAAAVARGFGARFIEPDRRRLELISRLSDTQKQIAPLLAEGHTERGIAERLARSAHTIHEHTREIYRAFGVRSRMQLRDIWNGLAEAPPPMPREREPEGQAGASQRR